MEVGMENIMYPKRIEHRVHIPDFRYAQKDDIIYVNDFFVLLFLYLKTSFFEETEQSIRLLLCTILELYGWRDIPLYVVLKNPRSTLEEIEEARALRFDEHGEDQDLLAIDIYWSYHDALLQVPLAWFRPYIQGDVFCHERLRFPGLRRHKDTKPHLPSLSNEVYMPFRKNLINMGKNIFEHCQDIERVFVEFYGTLSRDSITVEDILKVAPEIEKDLLNENYDY